VALSGERVALNLLSHASAIATYTHQLVKKASAKNIVILDTRKTTPGLRWLEKYAVVCGGGKNHRWSQTDMWMIKDNHKTLMGGVKGALEYFQNMGAYYNPILLEVHSLEELRQGLELGIRHFMLDNFSSNDIAKAVAIKKAQTTFEISGGVTLENIDQYLIAGIDAISVGSLTQNPPRIDLSLKMESRA
jgi:nicotinate-nucleotide pyrophosphorylase (carboxylating)